MHYPMKLPLSENEPFGLVVFVHASASGRFAPRNKFIADTFNRNGLATVFLDLMTLEEERLDNVSMQLRFDMNVLTERIITSLMIIHRIESVPYIKDLKIGLMSTSTAGGACMIAASKLQDLVSTVALRGGRPDLATTYLKNVECPSIFVVGQNDQQFIDLNEKATRQMITCPHKVLTTIPGAGHLFDERGKLEEVSEILQEWFIRYLKKQE
ncbi:alpha/beta hydrolase [Acrasis kona]|uniref:Alpha/beta hydrolase n=1 Tax=Acrasis kona TaxID=1008807 RepID=A0AAW2YIW0_9EUKA